MMKKFKSLTAILFCIFALMACGGAAMPAEEALYSPSMPPAMGEEAAYAEISYAEEEMVQSEKVVDGVAVEQPQERLIIRTGYLSMSVTDTEESFAQIESMAMGLGGWVVNSNSNRFGDGLHGTMTVRIPAAHYAPLMNDFRNMAVEVISENSSGQDVTDEFVDLSSRLQNLEATADRVRAFLNDADSVEEALEVNKELSRLEGEIEVIKGRMQFLSQSAAFSTITVELYPDAVAQPIEVARWLPAEVAESAIEALAETMQGVANFVIWLTIYFLPVGLVLGLPTWFVGRWGWRKWNKREAQPVVQVEQ